ncbi:bifunctional UDP-sugar hydrolase/5'-nucleotidase [Sporosarcina oncorhynchi]|uniref:Bifunctional UDP-sugar hydrolase/5'-nucleotidase n=1 Tax=Sporosarcina oncorhynchi TaxID=3056444 RepID=A0ABZ0L2M7_9BACL|nr:bifunctional UDP-sugar hydrolase/5'-nucleotidase [Sporosarcina sp. T2O-4]WOV86859.1 bifunctional UDP-sugar hydrolase/5'-nucleotidase [Sporosarcina sp. T2O-4]
MNVPKGSADSEEDSITILFTHDLHDNYLPFEVERGQGKMTVGGYGRLASAIEEQRAIDPDALLVDAGDFAMGTLFQTIFTTYAPGLQLLGQMGYDATTFGNHEFDFRADGLTKSLLAAKGSGAPLPAIVASNVVFPTDKDGEVTADLLPLQEAMDEYGVKEYEVLERKGVKIGLFGLMGEEAAGNAPMSGVSFADGVESAKSTVTALKKEGVDLIIALSHSGTSDDPSLSEDERIAKKVPGIDVIISGHSHTTLLEPIIVGNTIVASAGEYGEHLGILNVSKDEKGKWAVNQYELRKIDDSLPSDPLIDAKVNNYKQVIQNEYLRDFGMEFDEVLAHSSFDFTPFIELGVEQKEEPIGNLIGDAFMHTIEQLEGSDYVPIAAAVVPYGNIRNSFMEGDITVSDVFNVNSLGIGPDGISGYPLLDIYLTGKELKTIAEVDASITPIMPEVQLYIAGLSYTFNTNRFLFNKVTDVNLQSVDGTKEDIDDKKLYRVIGGLYSVQMLPYVNEKSFGILSIVPKNEDGTPVDDFEDRILYMNGHQEVKEWYAIANYFKSFKKVDSRAQVPAYYEQTQDRKIVEHDANVLAIVQKPNGIILTVYGIGLGLIGIVTALLVFIFKRRKRRTSLNSIR